MGRRRLQIPRESFERPVVLGIEEAYLGVNQPLPLARPRNVGREVTQRGDIQRPFPTLEGDALEIGERRGIDCPLVQPARRKDLLAKGPGGEDGEEKEPAEDNGAARMRLRTAEGGEGDHAGLPAGRASARSGSGQNCPSAAAAGLFRLHDERRGRAALLCFLYTASPIRRQSIYTSRVKKRSAIQGQGEAARVRRTIHRDGGAPLKPGGTARARVGMPE